MIANYTIKRWMAALCVAMTTAAVAKEVRCESPMPKMDMNQAPLTTEVEKEWDFSLSAGWSSKYVTEGLDCLPGSGIWEVAPCVSWNNFSLSAWYASGVSENYDEVDLVLGYEWNIGKWTINPWYEHQFYMTQDYNVANPALTVSYAVTDWLTTGVETQVKVEHKRFESYYSAFVRLDWFPLENVTVSPMARYGYNGGYNVDYADGSNSIDWSLGVTWQLAEHFAVCGSVNYSQAATVLRRQDAGDEFWVGLRLEVAF